MDDKFTKFITYTKKLYKKAYGEPLTFTTFDNMLSTHQETIMRLGIEKQFFGIDNNDIDSLVILSHLYYLKTLNKLPALDKLYNGYLNDDYTIIKVANVV